MGGTVRHAGRGPPGRLWTNSRHHPPRTRDTCGARGAVWAAMRRGLVHVLAWSLATGAAVTLSWWGVHTVMAGTAYDPPRALPIAAARLGRPAPGADTPPAPSPSDAAAVPQPVAVDAGRRASRRPRGRRHRHRAGAGAVRTTPPARTAARASRRRPSGNVQGLRRPRAAGSSSTSARRPRRWCRRRRTPAGRCRCGRPESWIRVEFTSDADAGRRCSAPGTTARRGWRSTTVLSRSTVPAAVAGCGRVQRDRRCPAAESAAGGAGDGASRVASVTGAAPPVKSTSARPCSTRPGCGSPAARRVSSATGSGAVGGDQDGVAEAAAAQHGRVGDQREFGERGGGGGDLAAQMGQRRPVGEVGGVQPAGRAAPGGPRRGTRCWSDGRGCGPR